MTCRSGRFVGFIFVAFPCHKDARSPARQAGGSEGEPEGSAPQHPPQLGTPPHRLLYACADERASATFPPFSPLQGAARGACSLGGSGRPRREASPPSTPPPSTEGARVFPFLSGAAAAAFPRPLASCLGAAIPAARREEVEDGGWDWRGGGGGSGRSSSGYAKEAVGSQRQSWCGPRLSREAAGVRRHRPPRRRTLLLSLPRRLSRLPRLPRSPALAPARHGRWLSAVSLCAALRGREPPLPLSGAGPPRPGEGRRGGEKDVGHQGESCRQGPADEQER